MNTVNLILTIVLSAMIGFAIGNAWGREAMKRTFSEMLKKMIEGLNLATKTAETKKESDG